MSNLTFKKSLITREIVYNGKRILAENIRPEFQMNVESNYYFGDTRGALRPNFFGPTRPVD